MRGISSPWKFYRAWFLFLLEQEFFWEAHRILQSFYNIILFRQAILCLERFLIKASQSRDESTSIAVAAAKKVFLRHLKLLIWILLSLIHGEQTFSVRWQ